MTDPAQQPSEIDLGQEVPEELHPLLKSLVDNLKAIIISIAAVLLAVGGYSLYGHVQASNLAQAREELGRIQAGTAGPDQIQALQDLLADSPGGLETATRLALAKAQTEAGQHADAAATWAQVAAEPGLVTLAGLARAASLSRADDHQGALEALQGVRPTAPEGYTAQIVRMTAAEAEAAGDIQAALSAFRELKELGGDRNQAYLDHKIARLTEALETKAAAEPAS